MVHFVQVWHYSSAEAVPSAHYDLPLGSWSFQLVRLGSLAQPLAEVDKTPIFLNDFVFDVCHDFLLIHAIIYLQHEHTKSEVFYAAKSLQNRQ